LSFAVVRDYWSFIEREEEDGGYISITQRGFTERGRVQRVTMKGQHISRKVNTVLMIPVSVETEGDISI
jgi:hypothetical protein